MSQTAQVTAMSKKMDTANTFPLMGQSHGLGKGEGASRQVLSASTTHASPWSSLPLDGDS